MSQESNSAKGICRIFAGGKTCRFGDNCRYKHSQNNQDESVKGIYQDSSGASEQRLCSSYLKTRFCRFGARCRYSHTLPAEDPEFLREQSTNQDEGLSKTDNETLASGSSGKPYYSLPLPKTKNGNDLRLKQHGSGSRSFKSHPGDSKVSNVKSHQNLTSKSKNVSAGVYDSGFRREGHGEGTAPRARSPRSDVRVQKPSNSAVKQQHQASSQNFEGEKVCDDEAAVLPEGSSQGRKPTQRQNRVKQQPRRKLCRYFKAGDCSMGKRCRFWHPDDLLANNAKLGLDKENIVPSGRRREPAMPKPTEYDLASTSEEELEKLRESEIDQLQKRYPNASTIEDEPDVWSCQLTFNPTDPDWVFDVKCLVLAVTFVDKYPSKPMMVTVVEEQEMPGALVEFTQRSVNDWISTRYAAFSERGKVELMFRQFTRWLDRNLEELFTEGLKQYRRQLMAAAAGVQFISGAELREEYSKKQASTEEDSDTGEESDYRTSEDDGSDEECEEVAPQPSHVGEMPPEGSNLQNEESLGAVRKGTEVKLMKLQMEENAATLRAQKVRIIMQCARCKTKAEVLTPCGRINQLVCSKCSQDMLVTFRANMAHQFSSVIGYIDLINCIVFDLILIDCQFEVGCFNCNKDMQIEGLPVGQAWETFCHHCHKKMKLSTESVRFQQLAASVELDASDAHVLETKKTKKIPKDPAIQLGKPLPYEGTCKHYKKSFRWLRFPCCGKAYPCDVCHEESEGDHEMARANRMICGFCCKEQMYAAEKPCTACGYHLTKKGTSHWEGGRGCRDKIKMSRDDDKKFSNMSKTVSKRAQAKKDAKGKKSTKLRHA